MEFKEIKLKYLDYEDKVMIVLLTNAPNKALNDSLKETLEANEGSWHRELFKKKVERTGYLLDYVNFDLY